MLRTRNRARGGGGGGVPFTPLSLGADLMAWYDATDSATITHAAGVVSQWNDKSTNVRHISQAGATTLRPTWNLTDSVSFDGGDYLFNNTPFMYANGGVAIYAVVTIPNSTGLALLAEGRSSTATPLYVPVWTEQPTSSPDVAMFIRNDASSSTYVGTSGLGGTFFDNTKKIVRFVDTGSTFTGYAAGVQAGVVAYTRADPTTLDRFTIGGLLRNTFSSGIIGSISEIIIAKNDTYGFEMEGYLANKHGL